MPDPRQHEDCSFAVLRQTWDALGEREALEKGETVARNRYRWCMDTLFDGGLLDACQDHVRQREWCYHGEQLLRDWSMDTGAEGLLALLERDYYNITEHHIRMVRAHLACARQIIQEGPLDRGLQWTSGTMLEDVVQSASGGLWDQPPFGPAFFESLVRLLSPNPYTNEVRLRSPTRSASILFPSVLTEGGGRGVVIARFKVGRLEEGNGHVFLHPSQAFLNLREDFRSCFSHARELNECSDIDADFRVSIEPIKEDKARLELPLGGPSAGGALYLGIRSALEGVDLEGNLIASFALTEGPDEKPDGRCHPVGFIKSKGFGIQRDDFDRFLVATDQEGADTLEDHARDLKVLRATTVEGAWEHATGRLAELQRYLEHVIDDVRKTAHRFVKRDMPRVHTRVRVSSEPLPFEQVDRSDEQALIGSLEDRERLYRHRMGRSGSMEEFDPEKEGPKQEEETYETLDWEDEVVGSGLKRGVILGDPGLGKTWLLHWEARRLAQEGLDQLDRFARPDEIQIPVLLPLYDVAKAIPEDDSPKERSFRKAVIECFEGKFVEEKEGEEKFSRVRDLIKDRMGEEGVWLLLDALDEVVDNDSRNALTGTLRKFVTNNPDPHLLLTSRTTRYKEDPFSVRQDSTERKMELLPFGVEQIEEFAHGYFEDETADEFLTELKDSVQIRGMAEVPLLLTFLCELYQGAEQPDLQGMNRADIYEQIVTEKLISAKWKDRRAPDNERDALDELSAVAFTLLIQGELQPDRGKLRDAIKFSYSKNWGGDPSRKEIKSLIDKEYTSRPGVLTRVGEGTDAPYIFVHLTVQEYLAARWIAERAKEDGWNAEIETGGGTDFGGNKNPDSVRISTLVDRKAWSPYWQQVILLLAGELKDREDLAVCLLELLVDEEKDDIFRHRLALAAHCLGEVMPQQD